MSGRAKAVLAKPMHPGPIVRVSTGLEGLDMGISGGFPVGSAILINGDPGSGKTIFGMTFLWNGAKKFRERGSYISFSESKAAMYENMRAIGMDFQALEDSGMFWYQDMPAATEKAMGDILTQALSTIKTNKVKRVVLDSISAVEQAFGHEYEARQVFHTVIEKLIRDLGCTTLVISERSEETLGHAPFEEFIADGILTLRRGLPRELEVKKLRGTRLARRRYAFTFDQGFNVVETHISTPDKPQEWKPIPATDSMISSGSEDVDRALGGGFPSGTYAVLEADTNVSLKEIRLFTHGMMMNFLSQGQGVMFVPVGGADAQEVVSHVRPYLEGGSLEFLRVAEELKVEEAPSRQVEIPPYVVLMKGGRNNIDVDTYMLFDTVNELKRLTGDKPVLRIMGYDTMESKYAEIPEKLYNEIGFAVMRTRAAGDLSVGIARPRLGILPKILDMVDWHLKLWRTDGTLMFQGVKPLTPLYAVQCDTSKGYPRTRLVEMS